MAVGILEIGQLVSMLLAAGTPAMTYYVMGRQHKQQIAHMEEKCKTCKAGLDEKINCLDETLGEVEVRQKDLRENDLPDKYVKRRDLEALERKHEKEVDIIHQRIEKYHPAT